MINTRERRWKRLEAAYGLLPKWLQVVLYPWMIPARWLAYFPVFTPVVCLAGAGFLAYLKLAYLHEQVTWSQVAMMGVAPLIVPPLMVYVAFPFVICLFVVPILVPLALAKWWRGAPLSSLFSDRPGKPAQSSRGDRLLWDPDLDG
jgi:hypothetical protein